jgi:ERCC4-type nuclease
MTPSFFIDNREHALIEALGVTDCPLAIVPLDIGDFQVRDVDTDTDASTDAIKYIIERKTIADLDASIIDGRYHEQKKRALAVASARFIYIIEGNFEFDEKYKTRSSSIINSSMRDGIPCLFTASVQETAVLITQIMERVTKDPAKYFGEVSDVSTSYGASATAQFVHTKKKENMDKNAVLIIQLSAIPGISYKKARCIVDSLEATSISDLCDKLKATTHKDLTKKVDGIGKVLAKSLYEFCGISP